MEKTKPAVCQRPSCPRAFFFRLVEWSKGSGQEAKVLASKQSLLQLWYLRSLRSTPRFWKESERSNRLTVTSIAHLTLCQRCAVWKDEEGFASSLGSKCRLTNRMWDEPIADTRLESAFDLPLSICGTRNEASFSRCPSTSNDLCFWQ